MKNLWDFFKEIILMGLEAFFVIMEKFLMEFGFKIN
jgi:hypothetical protein